MRARAVGYLIGCCLNECPRCQFFTSARRLFVGLPDKLYYSLTNPLRRQEVNRPRAAPI